MADDGPYLEGTNGDEGGENRLARIRALPDQTLLYYFALLSDGRYITNVSVLPAIEKELRARNIPGASTN